MRSFLALLKARVYGTALLVAVCSVLGLSGQVRDRPFLDTELVFPLEHWHNHASMVVELPGGDLFVCWFHGSGERTADDVVIRGARLRKGRTWSEPFLLADTWISGHERNDLPRPEKASVADVADDSRQRMAHGPHEVRVRLTIAATDRRAGT